MKITAKPSFYDLNIEQLKKCLLQNNFKESVASDLYNWHYKKKKFLPCEIKISESSKKFIYENFDFNLPEIHTLHESKDSTVKFLFKLSDGKTVESVLIPFLNHKYSICISSQVGCAMNCSFCFTGTQGLTRHLKTSEIIGQFLSANKWLDENRSKESRISNIVFMGQGEPLNNFEAVKEACNIFTSNNGFSIGQQKITISTSGYLPGLQKWIENPIKVNLALSLHSTDSKKREQLIPISKKYNLNEVLNHMDQIQLLPKQFFTFEYLLIKDFNDSESDANELGNLLKNKRALINLIPFNPFPGSKYERPSIDTIQNFKSVLDTYKIPTMIRTTKGDDVLAACGQLNSLIS